eukprot:773164-Rhodomonas_salina.1
MMFRSKARKNEKRGHPPATYVPHDQAEKMALSTSITSPSREDCKYVRERSKKETPRFIGTPLYKKPHGMKLRPKEINKTGSPSQPSDMMLDLPLEKLHEKASFVYLLRTPAGIISLLRAARREEPLAGGLRNPNDRSSA